MSIEAFIDAAVLKNGADAREAFNDAIAPRLAAAIEELRPSVAASMFAAPTQETE